MQSCLSLCMNPIQSNENDCINSLPDCTSTLCEDMLPKYCIARVFTNSQSTVGLELDILSSVTVLRRWGGGKCCTGHSHFRVDEICLLPPSSFLNAWMQLLLSTGYFHIFPLSASVSAAV